MSLSSTTRRLRRALAPLLIAVAVLGAAQPALAVTWFSASSPLKVYEDDRPQGYAYGNFINYNGVSARQTSRQRDAKPGGQGIYVESSFYFYGPCQQNEVKWCLRGAKQTENTTSGSWIADYTAKYLDSGASQARASTKICENHNNWWDPCSVYVTRSFSY